MRPSRARPLDWLASSNEADAFWRLECISRGGGGRAPRTSNEADAFWRLEFTHYRQYPAAVTTSNEADAFWRLEL